VRPAHTLDLTDQFIFCDAESYLPARWPVRVAGRWHLAAHPHLPVIEVLAPNESHVGWLLGYPITPHGDLLSSQFSVSVDPAAPNAVTQFEEALYTLGGRFVAILLGRGGGGPQVYMDPCGSMAAVFCPEDHIVASSPALIPRSPRTPENTSLIESMNIIERGGWYPFGLTPRHGIERLLPNHVLDLSTWEPFRHWPKAGDLVIDEDTAAAVAEFGTVLERQIAAAVRAYPAYMTLTAGRHTRMMLACARGYLDRIVFFSIPVPDPQGTLDYRIARQIARRTGVRYAPIRWEPPVSADLEEWFDRTGGCVAGRVWTVGRTLRQLDQSRCLLHGNIGLPMETMWRNTDADGRSVSNASLLERMTVPALPEVVDRLKRWLQQLPTETTTQILDLLHIEQRFGCWAGPQEYGHGGVRFRLSPYCHRRIVHRMMTLPIEYRRRRGLELQLIGGRWPQLLDLPFNQPTGIEGLQRSLAHTLRAVPRRILRPW
jgi:hypothetical protein